MRNLKQFAFCSCFIISFSNGLCQKLFPYIENGKWGYINSIGEVRIPPRYAKAYPFQENVAAVYLDGVGWGYIDTLGSTVIPAFYSYASNFSEGLAAVRTCNGDWVYINKKGEVEIPVGSDPLIVGDFCNGMAYLDYGTICGYLKRDSKKKIKNFTIVSGENACSDFSMPLIFGKEKNKGEGYFDKNGNKQVGQNNWVNDKRVYQKDGKFGFQDSITNERFLSATYDFVYIKSGDSIAVVEDSSKYMLYNLNTHKFIFNNITSIFVHHFFSPYERKYNGIITNGELIAAIVDKKFVYLNRKGEIVWVFKS